MASRRGLGWLALAGLALAVFVLAGHAALGQAAASGPAPKFVRKDLAGKPFRLADTHGQVVLLNFWASWCGPCLEETPQFVAWQEKYRTQGLRVVGVSMDDDAGPVKPLAAKLHWNYPIVMGDEKLGRLYGDVMGLPVTFLIDRKGRIRARYESGSDLERMAAQLRGLLAEPGGR